jgi:hypothetical protein
MLTVKAMYGKVPFWVKGVLNFFPCSCFPEKTMLGRKELYERPFFPLFKGIYRMLAGMSDRGVMA